MNIVQILLFALSVGGSSITLVEAGTNKWWEHTSIYQVYPLSMKDSNNDGRGDLAGITEKIQYLKETGFQSVWLSPIYASPMIDFGYDISNFTDIHEWYGTMEDFDQLLKTVHDAGMKLIMDFVPNHSSNEHEWFKKSRKRDPQYDDYYVWRDPKGFDEDGKPIQPNNWLSVFHGPAWTYDPERKQFYLHQFASAQPDLNYRNPKVVEEMKDVMRFWSQKGVDGFRMDAILFLYESPSFEDEPVAANPSEDPLNHGYLRHIHTQNLPETFEMVQQWRQVIDQEDAADGRDRCLMVEAYASIDDTMRYFGTREHPGAHFPFNFNLLYTNNQSTAQDVMRSVNSWMDNMPLHGHANWVIGNHDQARIGTKVGEDLINGMNMILLLLPGVSVTYYGEEIGMVNNYDITYEQGVDPQGCNHPKEEFKERSRDFERTPFQWDNTVNAGFNSGGETWLPVHSNYKWLNLKAQQSDPYSHYSIFKDLMKARKLKAVRDGGVLLRTINSGIFGLVRGVSSEEYVVALVNFSYEEKAANLDEAFLLGDRKLQVVTTDPGSGYKKGQIINATEIHLPARTSLLITAV